MVNNNVQTIASKLWAMANELRGNMDAGEFKNYIFFRNSKHTVTMDTANELTGHMKRALQIIFVTASRAESRFTSKRNKLQFPTVWASQKSATKRTMSFS